MGKQAGFDNYLDKTGRPPQKNSNVSPDFRNVSPDFPSPDFPGFSAYGYPFTGKGAITAAVSHIFLTLAEDRGNNIFGDTPFEISQMIQFALSIEILFGYRPMG